MTRQRRIETYLEETLAPLFLEVQNESQNHHVPLGSETHFKVTVVSEKFAGLTRLERHRLVHELLENELNNGLHALSLHLYTMETWMSLQHKIPVSPDCLDGYDQKTDFSEG